MSASLADHAASPLADRLNAFLQLRLDVWFGLPPHASMGEARKILGLDGELEGRARLGSSRQTADRESMDDRPLVLWHRAGELLLLDYEGPFDDLDIRSTLGAPSYRLDVNWGVAPLSKGEWVFPERGLSAIVSPAGLVMRLFGFSPISLDEYLRDLRLNPTSRPFPEGSTTPVDGTDR